MDVRFSSARRNFTIKAAPSYFNIGLQSLFPAPPDLIQLSQPILLTNPVRLYYYNFPDGLELSSADCQEHPE
jgi:hypothetical protein